jgi:hypothetical protein
VDEPLTLRASLARADVHGRLFVVVLALWLVIGASDRDAIRRKPQ